MIRVIMWSFNFCVKMDDQKEELYMLTVLYILIRKWYKKILDQWKYVCMS